MHRIYTPHKWVRQCGGLRALFAWNSLVDIGMLNAIELSSRSLLDLKVMDVRSTQDVS